MANTNCECGPVQQPQPNCQPCESRKCVIAIGPKDENGCECFIMAHLVTEQTCDENGMPQRRQYLVHRRTGAELDGCYRTAPNIPSWMKPFCVPDGVIVQAGEGGVSIDESVNEDGDTVYVINVEHPENPEVVLNSPDGTIVATLDPADPTGHTWNLSAPLAVLTSLPLFEFDGATNLLTIQYVDENGATTEHTVDLSALAIDVNVGSITFDPVTGNFLLTETDGQTHPINIPPVVIPDVVLTSPDSSVQVVQDPADSTGHTWQLTVTHPDVVVTSNDGSVTVVEDTSDPNLHSFDLSVPPAPAETLTSLPTFDLDPATNILTIEYVDEAGVTTTRTVDLSALAIDVNTLSLGYDPASGNLTLTETDGEVHQVQIGPIVIPEVVITSPDDSVTVVQDPADPTGHTWQLSVDHPPFDCDAIKAIFDTAGTIETRIGFDAEGNCVFESPDPCAGVDCSALTATASAASPAIALDAPTLNAACPAGVTVDTVTYEVATAGFTGQGFTTPNTGGVPIVPAATDAITVETGDVLIFSIDVSLQYLPVAGGDITLTPNGLPLTLTEISAIDHFDTGGTWSMRTYTFIGEATANGTGTIDIDGTYTPFFGSGIDGQMAWSAVIAKNVDTSAPNQGAVIELETNANTADTACGGGGAQTFTDSGGAQSDVLWIIGARHVECVPDNGVSLTADALTLVQTNPDVVNARCGQNNCNVTQHVAMTPTGGDITVAASNNGTGCGAAGRESILGLSFVPTSSTGGGTGSALAFTESLDLVLPCDGCCTGTMMAVVPSTGPVAITGTLAPGSSYLVELLINGAVAASTTLANTGAAAAPVNETIAATSGAAVMHDQCDTATGTFEVRVTCQQHVEGTELAVAPVTLTMQGDA